MSIGYAIMPVAAEASDAGASNNEQKTGAVHCSITLCASHQSYTRFRICDGRAEMMNICSSRTGTRPASSCRHAAWYRPFNHYYSVTFNREGSTNLHPGLCTRRTAACLCRLLLLLLLLSMAFPRLCGPSLLRPLRVFC